MRSLKDDVIDPFCFIDPPPPDIAHAILGTTLLIGILGSEVPQFYRIIKQKTSEGISPYFLSLKTNGNLFTLINAFVFKWSHIDCCRKLVPLDCFIYNLDFLQLGASPFASCILFILFLVYFKVSPNEKETTAQRIKKISLFDHIFDYSFCNDTMRFYCFNSSISN